MGEPFEVLVDAIRFATLDRESDGAMELAAALKQQHLVGDVAYDRVLEADGLAIVQLTQQPGGHEFARSLIEIDARLAYVAEQRQRK
jgi:hypothetical protein